jgi:hypothetical protein
MRKIGIGASVTASMRTRCSAGASGQVMEGPAKLIPARNGGSAAGGEHHHDPAVRRADHRHPVGVDVGLGAKVIEGGDCVVALAGQRGEQFGPHLGTSPR